MTARTKANILVERLKDYAPLMSFFAILTFGASGIFWLGSFTKEIKQIKEQSLSPLEKERLLEHERISDDVKAYQALEKYNKVTMDFLDTKDSLYDIIIKNDSLSKLNYTTQYQMKQAQNKFFIEVKQMMKSLEKNDNL